ncbi:hypothetical protein S0112_080 [Shewanella phage S0112]|nr:hypothetical protein S0112_080 [Shewanella phage S0112]
MAFISGTATNAENLLSIFRTFITSHPDLLDPAGDGSLPSQAWQELKYVAGTPGGGTGSSPYELYLRGPGLANQDNIYINVSLQNVTTTGLDSWLWRIDGATGFLAGSDFGNQPGNNPNTAGSRYINMPLYDQSMPYWIYANGRRFIVIAQVTASVYVHCYGGFLIPYAPALSALEYQYPLYIGANQGLPARFSNTSPASMRSFWNPAYADTFYGSAFVYTPGNTWQWVRNVTSANSEQNDDSSIPDDTSDYPIGRILPRNRYWNGAATGTWPLNQTPLLDGSYLLYDLEVVSPSTNFLHLTAFYGVLDGVSWLSGVSQSSQNTLAIGSDTYIVFQEAHRTDEASFIAILES